MKHKGEYFSLPRECREDSSLARAEIAAWREEVGKPCGRPMDFCIGTEYIGRVRRDGTAVYPPKWTDIFGGI